ncbi:MAG: MFS transporter [Gammaproteobacteria bacterium]|nr:MFS transporter [Gammaproteobacteria bacterium]
MPDTAPDQTALPSRRYRTMVLLLLTLVYGFNFVDRQIVGILAPYIQADLDLTNTQLGLLIGLAFAFLYTTVAIPIAWLADRYNRVNILAIALAMWSGFTALTGMANNFVQIALARAGVGIGEAGGSPPSHSIISDMYAKRERAGALGVYSMGIPFGIMFAYFATASLMGKSGEEVDWRRVFIILGMLGIGLAIIVRLVLREPKRGAMEIGNNAEVPQKPFKESLRTLLSIPSWWFMCLGIATGSFVSYAFSAFQTKYIVVFDPDFNFKTLVIALGIINGIAYAGGTYTGAKVADWWGKRDIRAYGWLPAITMTASLPFAVAGFWVPTVWSHLVCTTLLLWFLGAYLGPCFAIAQTLAPINMRAMSTALFFFILNMIALGGGPTTAGFLIDVFAEQNSELTAIRYAMTAVCMMFLLAIGFFLLVSRNITRDWAAAEQRNESPVD